MPDLLHQFTTQRVANMVYQSGAGLAIGGIHPDLDQLVAPKRLIDGAEHRRRQAVGADDKHRFPGMSQGLKMTFLRIVEHGCRESRSCRTMTTKPTLPPRAKTFTVAPSPFNSIKFELGVILCVGLLLLLLTSRVIGSTGLQLALLAAYGLIGTAWLLIRTHRILVRRQAAARHSDNEPQ